MFTIEQRTRIIKLLADAHDYIVAMIEKWTPEGVSAGDLINFDTWLTYAVSLVDRVLDKVNESSFPDFTWNTIRRLVDEAIAPLAAFMQEFPV